MMAHADLDAVRDFLRRGSRRVLGILVLHGATTGFVLAFVASVIVAISRGVWDTPAWLPLGAPLIGIAVGMVRGLQLRARMANVIEAKVPQGKNLLITVGEWIHCGAVPTGYVSDLVLGKAAQLTRTLDLAAIFPMQRATIAAVGAALLCSITFVHRGRPTPLWAERVVAGSAAPELLGMTVDLIPPAYVGGPVQSLHDPLRIEALAGSRIHLVVHARGDSVSVETVRTRTLLTPGAAGEFTGDLFADADGYIAIAPLGPTTAAGARRLIGLSITPDAPPTVRITAPAHDLKLANGHHTIDVAITATDDIALASLHLRYTRVSGSGERFTFTQGDVPLVITRTTTRAWQAHAAWRLDSLALDAGDIVVYRAVAADNRPGASPTESDSWIAEVLAPGNVAAAGFSIDPDVERYALSQQMVIVKTERLMARKGSLAADSLADAAADIAAEQRGVRAEFVFMMGGEIGGADDGSGNLNEEAEAAGESDLAAGRMLNQGRAALLSAIRFMSRADKALTTPDLNDALTQERAALAQLEKTFSHSRLILRALTERERLDLSRRLTGVLADATRDAEPVAAPVEDPVVAPLRRALADIATLAADSAAPSMMASRTSALAEQVLRIDPAATTLQGVSRQLSDAATAMSQSHPAAARNLLDKAATALADALRRDLPLAPPPHAGLDAGRLAGALADARHAARGAP